jgi:hypothetical protein
VGAATSALGGGRCGSRRGGARRRRRSGGAGALGLERRRRRRATSGGTGAAGGAAGQKDACLGEGKDCNGGAHGFGMQNRETAAANCVLGIEIFLLHPQ